MPRIPDDYTCVLRPLAPISSKDIPAVRKISPSISNTVRSLLKFVPAIASFLLLFTFHTSAMFEAHAQGTTATLSGVVEDEAGAVIPGVNVAVISLEQGFRRSTLTNGEGIFIVPQLSPGPYTVKVEHQSFIPTESKVVLNVNDQRTIKITLKIGNLQQTVEVLTTPMLIDESAAVGTTVDRQFIENMPLNGRSFQSLIALTPGTVLTKASADNPGQISINGQRGNANYFTVDGVGANIAVTRTSNVSQTLGGSLPGLTAQGGTNSLVSVDALQEFKVLTSTYAPEFGRSPGGQVSMITRSGTNNFHGTVFEYFRHDVFDANDWFGNATRLPKPKERQHDFGGTLGGPIFLPRFGEGGRQPWYDGHNRTFFFFSYEGLRLQQPQVAANVDVPSLSLRQTALPRIQPFLHAFPIPNGADLGNGLAQFSASYSNPSRLNATSIRIDHAVNSRLNTFFRYNNSPSEVVARGTSSLSSPTFSTMDTMTLTGGATFTFQGQTINDLRANYSRVNGDTFNFLDTFGGAVPIPIELALPPFVSPENSFFSLLVNLGPTLSLGKTAASVQRQVNIVDTLSTIAGNHQLKFGVDYRRLTPTFGPATYALVAFFNNATAARTATASSLNIQGRQQADLIFSNFSAFAQDTWKSHRKLTLTYGVRWEVNPPPKGVDGNNAFTVLGIDNPATITLAPRGTQLYKTTYNNFAPRFGVAYQLVQTPGRETVLRGGVGLFYDLGSGQAAQGFTSPPFSTGAKLPLPTNVAFPATPAILAPPSTPTPPFTLVNGIDPNLKLPRVYQWNFAIEQALGSNQTLTTSYVAALGRRLVSVQSLQNPNATFANVNIVRNRGTSDYHAFEAQFQRRLSRGLQALASYTWSHSIDLVSSDFGVDLDRGPSDFDIRHSFSSAVSYDIPAPRSGSAVRAILGGWGLDTIVHSQTATPVNVLARQLFSVAGTFINVRPDLTEGIPVYVEDPAAPGGWKLNNTVVAGRPGCKGPFCPPPSNRQGSLGRNALRSFPLNQIDLSLRRAFRLRENVALQFRTDIFNIFNHPNFGDPSNLLTRANFGLATTMFGRGLGASSAGLSPLYQIGGPRSMQFSLKLLF